MEYDQIIDSSEYNLNEFVIKFSYDIKYSKTFHWYFIIRLINEQETVNCNLQRAWEGSVSFVYFFTN